MHLIVILFNDCEMSCSPIKKLIYSINENGAK